MYKNRNVPKSPVLSRRRPILSPGGFEEEREGVFLPSIRKEGGFGVLRRNEGPGGEREVMSWLRGGRSFPFSDPIVCRWRRPGGSLGLYLPSTERGGQVRDYRQEVRARSPTYRHHGECGAWTHGSSSIGLCVMDTTRTEHTLHLMCAGQGLISHLTCLIHVYNPCHQGPSCYRVTTFLNCSLV